MVAEDAVVDVAGLDKLVLVAAEDRALGKGRLVAVVALPVVFVLLAAVAVAAAGRGGGGGGALRPPRFNDATCFGGEVNSLLKKSSDDVEFILHCPCSSSCSSSSL